MSLATVPRSRSPSATPGETAPGAPSADEFTAAWNAAVRGDADARARWSCTEGAGWAWGDGGVRVGGGEGDWHGLASDTPTAEARRAMGRFRVEVTVSGTGRAAGLSLGPYRDLMARLPPSGEPRRVAFEADLDSGCWAFFVDGEPQPREWWDADVTAAALAEGRLHLKAFQPGEVRFSALAVHALPPVACRLSVLLTCHRFSQRLRVTLRNWCQQTLPMGAYEVLVVNPGSPDATHAVLESAARAWPGVGVREIGMGGGRRNKGEMINRAFDASLGEWIWLTDADCLFPPDAAQRALAHAGRCHGAVLLHGERRFLSAVETDSLLAGRLDGLAGFAAVAARADARTPESAPWGYTQIVRRETFQRHRYSSAMNHFAHSDGQFADDCRRGGARAEPVPGLVCLHLDHPFAWFGTREML